VITDAAMVAERMTRLLAERPRTFYELIRELPDVEYRTILKSWGVLRERRVLRRDDHGRYLSSKGASATPSAPSS
jgi:hypothetical protein